MTVQVGEGTVIFDIDQVSVIEYDSYDCDEEEPKENIQKSLNSVNKLTIKPEITVPEDAFKDLDTYTINDLLPIFPYLNTIEYHLPPTIPLNILTSPLFQTQTSFFTVESHPSENYIVLRNPKFYYFSPECDYFNFTCNLFLQIKQEIVEEAGVYRRLRKPFQQLFVANLGDSDIMKLTHLEARDSKTLALLETLIVLILNLLEEDTCADTRRLNKWAQRSLFFQENCFEKISGIDCLYRYCPQYCSQIELHIGKSEHLNDEIRKMSVLTQVKGIEKLTVELSISQKNWKTILEVFKYEIAHLIIVSTKLDIKKTAIGLRKALTESVLGLTFLNRLKIQFVEDGDSYVYQRKTTSKNPCECSKAKLDQINKLALAKLLKKTLLICNFAKIGESFWKYLDVVDQ
ncbi:unnamed protein product [Moneuplotes crassus]|uniref:Uncharacterized protein n=1 Tax=Euplotes crassus TaxID=5936 RepID=A0AAD1Y5F1_EUPCR|nr:unnamed protein product [Moneuplotes crassus]